MTKTIEQRRADKAAYMRAKRAEDPEKYRAKSRAFNDKHRERLNAERNANYAANKHEIRASRRGVTAAEIHAVAAAQGGKCAICEKHLAPWPDPATHIDHCHDTGKVRGLLCRSCNLKEGWVRKYGQRLAEYLACPPADSVVGIA